MTFRIKCPRLIKQTRQSNSASKHGEPVRPASKVSMHGKRARQTNSVSKHVMLARRANKVSKHGQQARHACTASKHKHAWRQARRASKTTSSANKHCNHMLREEVFGLVLGRLSLLVLVCPPLRLTLSASTGGFVTSVAFEGFLCLVWRYQRDRWAGCGVCRLCG